MLKKTRAINRVSQIGDIILTAGFGYIRYNKNVEHCSTFISLFKQRMTDSLFNLCSLYSTILQNVSYTNTLLVIIYVYNPLL